MNKIGKYIYGFINYGAEKSFGRCGLESSKQVYTIPFKDISAVVSDSEIVDYFHIPKEVLAQQLVRHQKTIERVMLEHTIIPMRLGTFAEDEKEVMDILNKGYRIVEEILSKIDNKVEIDVVASWSNFESVIKEVGEEREIKEFKDKLLANSKGITIDDRMKVGVMVKKALDKKREICALDIQSFLNGIAQLTRAHELMDDKMVLNSAFLIEKSRQKFFEDKIEELNTGFKEKLNFRCVGPLPAYSFYTLEVKKINFNEINWARKRLCLGDNIANREEIKHAYRNMALSSHPDKSPDKPNVEKEFSDMNKAYKVLLDYCVALEQAGKEDMCSFNEEAFKNAILIKVRE